MIVYLKYEDNLVKIDDTDEVVHRILGDKKYANEYIKNSFENGTFGEDITVVNEDENCTKADKNSTSYYHDAESSSSPVHTLNSRSSMSFNKQNKFKIRRTPMQLRGTWTQAAVMDFLEECRKKRKEIRDPTIRRRIIFTAIRSAMKAKGYSFCVATLSKRLENMRTYYTKTLEKQKLNRANGTSTSVTWPYFRQMSEIYSDEIPLDDAPTISSMTSPQPSDSMIDDSSDKESLIEESPRPISSRTAKEKILTFHTKLLALEERKIELTKQIVEEMRQIRILMERRLEFNIEKQKADREKQKGRTTDLPFCD